VFRELDCRLRKSPPSLVILLAILATVVVGVLDYLTGVEVNVAIFYLIPISLATWYAGRPWGFAISLGSLLTSVLTDWLAREFYLHPAIVTWNAVIQLGFFLITSVLLDALHSHLDVTLTVARTDKVTGIANRHAFWEQLQYVMALSCREGRPFTLAYLDLDDFKRVNDTLGHDAGDRVLHAVAKVLSESVRRTDEVGRIGGDEFAILLPDTDERGARSLIETLQNALGKLGTEGEGGVTCSIGAVTFHQLYGDVGEAVRSADSLMYRVKRLGKNGVLFETIGRAA
jgi:diguanylate cyclase (GGDEF)-like protein